MVGCAGSATILSWWTTSLQGPNLQSVHRTNRCLHTRRSGAMAVGGDIFQGDDQIWDDRYTLHEVGHSTSAREMITQQQVVVTSLGNRNKHFVMFCFYLCTYRNCNSFNETRSNNFLEESFTHNSVAFLNNTTDSLVISEEGAVHCFRGGSGISGDSGLVICLVA